MVKESTTVSKVFDVILILVLVSVALLCVLPIWYTLMVSLSEKSAAAAGIVRLWPIGANLVSYQQIMRDSEFFLSFWVSVKRVVLGASLSFIVTVLMAYPLSKSNRDFRLRNILMWVLVFALLFNGGLIPLYQTVKAYGLIDSIWVLVLSGGLPIFNVILVMNFFRNLPKELEEAALVDGAGPWYTLFVLFIPLSVPVLATVSLFSIVGHWNEFFSGLVFMTKPENYPLQTYIRQMVVQIDPAQFNTDSETLKRLNEISNQTLNAAKIFIAMLPILVVYPFLQKFFIHGITLGSVKE
ncbi:carbohydrate ABC transporter permease [Paenibacillus elgii]|uniref:ABC transporter permease n=1 Tax=Paenibacillus elgii TaxID=189691 RepID=A0A2T6G8T1_9BACL|nr:carbohydrate ABC transporter permease [Paenibacillus elgii]NEN85804.1 carbohydrate ABC transporter permease [Paenibacillus elgii]PUA40559.1 ABC transporter permease [Paenibacillus elgii]